MLDVFRQSLNAAHIQSSVSGNAGKGFLNVFQGNLREETMLSFDPRGTASIRQIDPSAGTPSVMDLDRVLSSLRPSPEDRLSAEDLHRALTRLGSSPEGIPSVRDLEIVSLVV